MSVLSTQWQFHRCLQALTPPPWTKMGLKIVPRIKSVSSTHSTKRINLGTDDTKTFAVKKSRLSMGIALGHGLRSKKSRILSVTSHPKMMSSQTGKTLRVEGLYTGM